MLYGKIALETSKSKAPEASPLHNIFVVSKKDNSHCAKTCEYIKNEMKNKTIFFIEKK